MLYLKIYSVLHYFICNDITSYCIIYVMVCMNVYVHTYIHIYIYTTLYTYTYSIFICVFKYTRIYCTSLSNIFPNQKACHVANILSRLKAWVSGEGANSFPRSPQVGHLHRLIFVSIAWIFVDLWTSHQHVINCSSTFHNQKPLPLIESNLCLGVLGDLGQLS